MKLGQTIVEIRKEHGLTQEDLAQEFNVTRQTVSNWENEKSYPDLLTLIRISDTYHYSLDKMLKEDIDMTETMNRSIQLGNESRKTNRRNFYIGLIGGICCIALVVLSLIEKRGTLVVLLWTAAVLVNFSSVIENIRMNRQFGQQPKALSAEDAAMAKQLADRGMEPEAIKFVRKCTGLGLAEAKTLVEEMQEQ